MKRLWFGIALLILFLAAGIGMVACGEPLYGPIRQQLEEASASALREDWQAARADFFRAKERWEDQWHLVASVTDHAPMEEIDALFAQAELHATRQNKTLFPDTCAQLTSQLQDLIDTQKPTWWNIL